MQVVPVSLQEKEEKQENSQKGGEVQYREDWGVWDDMDITDDENDTVLVQSSEDNTATDDSDEDKKYFAQKEIDKNGGQVGNNEGTHMNKVATTSEGMLSDILSKVALYHNDSDVAYEGENEQGEEGENEEEEEVDGNNTFLTSTNKEYGEKKNNLRNVKSQPLLPSLPSSGGVQGGAKHIQKHKMLARSQSALHLGHYQFGDHTAHALSKTLGDLSGDQPPLKGSFQKLKKMKCSKLCHYTRL